MYHLGYIDTTKNNYCVALPLNIATNTFGKWNKIKLIDDLNVIVGLK